MNASDSSKPSKGTLLLAAERLVGHVMAMIAGVVLIFAGVGLGVTMVGLPVGVPVGLLGVLLFIWGLAVRRQKQQ